MSQRLLPNSEILLPLPKFEWLSRRAIDKIEEGNNKSCGRHGKEERENAGVRNLPWLAWMMEVVVPGFPSFFCAVSRTTAENESCLLACLLACLSVCLFCLRAFVCFFCFFRCSLTGFVTPSQQATAQDPAHALPCPALNGWKLHNLKHRPPGPGARVAGSRKCEVLHGD